MKSDIQLLVGILLLVLTVAVLLGGVQLARNLGATGEAPSLAQQSFQLEQLFERFRNQREILTPAPLRGLINRAAVPLTRAGVLAQTNRHRTERGLSPLTGNSVLDQAATAKLEDLFAQQYFEHVSPLGVGPADLVDTVQYSFLRVGENLALGNFEGDEGLVQAWMDSPGHRENILHPGFSELGIAVAEGIFEGDSVWIGVQTFALPLSVCPAIDAAVHTSVDFQQSSVDDLNTELTDKRASLDSQNTALIALGDEVDALTGQADAKFLAGNAKIQEGNVIAEGGGEQSVAEALWDEGTQLHAAGQELAEQAEVKREQYTQQADAYNKDREKYNDLVGQQEELHSALKDLIDSFNAQIKAFNSCLANS